MATTKDLIRYDLLVQDALRGVVRKVLSDAARDGLPGEHYFHVEFKTDAPGVKLSQRMRDVYPDKMTIVLQHQFDNLIVDETAFEVGLSFGGVRERLRIPFAAVMGFFDESVQFGLRFEVEGEASAARREQGAARRETARTRDLPKDDAKAEAEDKPANAPAEDGAAAPAESGAKVLSIDAFRKKT